MRLEVPQLETGFSQTDDPRSALVQRIVASPSFAKSERLRRFLLYICELSLQGRADEISELNIGENLFGRARDYDSSVDGIVRSHATRLRHRLEQYFNQEGRNEPIRLLIPKGGYVPVFEPRPEASAEELADAGTLAADTSSAPVKMEAVPTARGRHSPWMLVSFALALGCAAMVLVLAYSRTSNVTHAAESITSHALWGKFFGNNQTALVVCSDAGLSVLQQITGHRMKLADYLDADYRDHVIVSPSAAEVALQDVMDRRYTSIVNLLVVTRLFNLPGIYAHQIDVRYARDVRPDDLKDHPVILLGSHQTDPWVEMFDEGMNFTIQDDLNRGISTVINHSPRGNEFSHYVSYISDQSDRQRTVYAVVALRRNPEGARYVLMLEGTAMAGTEAAADFVVDDRQLLPFLAQIRRPDGSIPDFEVLLKSSSLGGYAPQSTIVAYRTSSD